MKNFNLNKSKFAKMQADGIFNSIQILNKNIQVKEKYIGEMNALNVMSGLCIELYLKAFTRTLRKDAVIKGHNLERLFNQLPQFLKILIKQHYVDNFDRNANLFKVSILIADNISETTLLPDKEKLDNFDDAIKTLSTIFLDSRYFFERLNERNWIVVEYYFDCVKAICISLKTVYEQYARGDFQGKIK
ncbi:hypothetical protein ACFX5U_07085 [Sphingobacterium sp. SG20118]|uniref:hypothetical protein n=1 Tax=Sphingobacterium sp. SG20118 TaxID=3367156 RepID=UPI0037DFC2C4